MRERLGGDPPEVELRSAGVSDEEGAEEGTDEGRRRRLRDGCSGTKKTNSTRTKAPTRTSPLGRVAWSISATAVLEDHFPPSTGEEDIAAAVEMQRLNADAGVQLLGEDPARFFSHTTKILGEKGATTTRVDSATTRAAPVLRRNPSRATDRAPPTLGCSWASARRASR